MGATGTDPERRAVPVTAGGLFIVATVANVAGTSLSRSLLDRTDYLGQVAANANRVTTGALLELLAAAASTGIAVALYPVLKTWGSGLALGSVVFRTIDAANADQARYYFGLDPQPSIDDIRVIAEHYPVFRADYAPHDNRQGAQRGRSQ